MKALVTSTLARLLAGTVLTVAAADLVAPSRAFATGCGTPRGTFHGDVPANPPDHAPAAPRGPAPCSGPHCSAAPFPLPLTTTPPAPTAEGPWGLPPAAPAVAGPAPGLHAPEPSLDRPARRAASVYRPPR
jgi:hypothetical protein